MTESSDQNPYAVSTAAGSRETPAAADRSAATPVVRVAVAVAVGIALALFTHSSRYAPIPILVSVFGGLGLQTVCLPLTCTCGAGKIQPATTLSVVTMIYVAGWAAYCCVLRLQMSTDLTTDDIWLLAAAIGVSAIIGLVCVLWVRRQLSGTSVSRTELSHDTAVQ